MEENSRAREAKSNSIWKIRKAWYNIYDEGFIFQRDRLPVYDIPNIEGFELSPYVEYLAPKVKVELLGYQKMVNEDKLAQIRKEKEEQNKTFTSA